MFYLLHNSYKFQHLYKLDNNFSATVEDKMVNRVKMKDWRKFQVVLIISILASFPLCGRINNATGTQKTVLIFQETRVFPWTINKTAIYLDVEFWRIIFSQKGFEIVVKYVGQDNFNPKEVIRHYSEISTEMYIVFNVHGARVLGSFFLKLDRWRASKSIINAIGDTKTCVVIASCHGGLATKSFNIHTQNIECVTFNNGTSKSFYKTDNYAGISIFQTHHGLVFVDLLRSYSPYEAFQILNRNESFGGVYWSLKKGLIR